VREKLYYADIEALGRLKAEAGEELLARRMGRARPVLEDALKGIGVRREDVAMIEWGLTPDSSAHLKGPTDLGGDFTSSKS
jgi:hypothetical protein